MWIFLSFSCSKIGIWNLRNVSEGLTYVAIEASHPGQDFYILCEPICFSSFIELKGYELLSSTVEHRH
jgi:hypothetical protein